MKATHTKGPWFSHIEKCGGNWTFDGKGVHIATVNKYRVDQRECDQALIAAAPDLLAACEAAYEELFDYAVKRGSGENGSTIQRLAQAINKARGQGKGGE